MKCLFTAVFVPLLAAGCATTQPGEVASAPDPADASAGLHTVVYEPVLGDYQHREPVGPRNWRQLNEELSPARRGGGS
jgi:hypothetical protein